MVTNPEVNWVDLSKIGVTLGSWRDRNDPAKSLPLAIVDMNGAYDAQIREMGFRPMEGVKAQGIYVRSDTAINPGMLYAAFGRENVRFVRGPRDHFDRLFREAFRARTQQNAAVVFAQNRAIGLNHLGEVVHEAVLGRFVVRDVNGARAIVRENDDDPAAFLRADTRESLQKIALGFVSRILVRNDNLRRDHVKNLVDVSNVGGFSMRDYQEAIEGAVNEVFMQRVREAQLLSADVHPLRAYDVANRLYVGMPELKERTVNSIANQQYSTPVPMAALAQAMLGRPADFAGADVLEPTIGNGSLVSLIAAAREQALGVRIHGCEIDPERVETAQLLADHVRLGDATMMDFRREFGVRDGFDFVIANPPFGSMDEVREVALPEGSLIPSMSVQRLDHYLMLMSLSARKDNGRAVFISGADNVMRPGEIKGRSTALLNYLHDHYEVEGVVDISGDLYKKHGAGYPLRLYVIGARRAEPMQHEVPESLPVIRSYEALRAWAEGLIVRRERAVGRDAAQEVAQQQEKATPSLRVPAVEVLPLADVPGTGAPLPGEGSTTVGTPTVVDLLEPRNNTADEEREDTRQESEYQQRYVAFSSVGEPSTMIPANLSGPVYEALTQIRETHGDVDEYVAKELEFSIDELEKYFSPEQVDALAMMFHATSRDLGFLLADQMGVGKGRTLAGFARRERLQGRIPMFVTITDNLFSDFLERDLVAIGSRHLFQSPLIVNDGAKTVDGEGNVIVRSMKRPEYRAHAEREELPEGADMILLTYSQLSRHHEKHLTSRYMRALCRRYPVSIILDEAHKGAGASNTSENLMGMIDGISYNGGNIVYSSATPIKGASNLSLYRKILPKGVDPQELLDAVNSDPISLQEALNYEIAAQGCLISRELDNTGIEKEFVVSRYVERNERVADQMAEILTGMNYLSGDVRKIVSQINKDFQKHLEGVPENERIGQRMGATSMNFGSRMHALVAQMLLALKSREIVDLALEAIENNEKPIIALQRTGESLLADFLSGRNSAYDDDPEAVTREFTGIELDEPITFKDYLRRMMERVMVIKETGRYGEVSERRASSEAVENSRKRILALIDQLPDDLPLTPLDYIRDELAKHGYTTGEISGRNLRTRTLDSGKILIEQVPGRTDKTRVQRAVREFNNGETDAIILTVSGSTGISLHASPAVGSDLRRRVMIKGEMQADITAERQMDGRPNRTGQIDKPRYQIVMSGLPADDRQAMMYNNKNRSLTASTVANRDSKDLIREVADLLNVVGDTVAADLLSSNRELAKHLDIALPEDDESVYATAPLHYVKVLTGRAPLLKVAEQRALYDELQARFHEELDRLKAEGRNPLEVVCYDWKATTIDRRVFMGATAKTENTRSQLNSPVYLTVLEYQEELKAVKATEVDAKIAESVAAGEINSGAIVNFLDSCSRQLLEGAKAKRFETVEQALADKEDNLVKDMAAKLQWLDMNLPLARAGGVFYRKDLEGVEVPHVVLRVQAPGKLESYTRLGEYTIYTMRPGSDLVSMDTFSALFANDIQFDPWVFHENEAARHAFDSAENGLVTKRARVLDGNLFEATALNLRERLGRKVVYTDHGGSRQHGILVYADVSDKTLESIPERLRDPALVRQFAEFKPITTHAKGDWRNSERDLVVGRNPTGQLYLRVPGTKKYGGDVFLDPALSSIKGQEDKCRFHLDFRPVNGFMTAALPPERATAVITYLIAERGYSFFTTEREELQRVRDIMARRTGLDDAPVAHVA
ncbi:strawberry notch-like NTP hydrolase domain-containing protein [Burkholderia vietnamiensis]|uniref:strawberry notch-like NTP hydrolase domain-containing protein n=1 Tax=Burkholderia vietnamiensis TaxID=60552 RepID=UPI00159451AD|nr:strawberry notch family protein [Burkholderia vietnamiensis]